ncbi:CAAX amino terminal protease family protein [Granulicella sibirica]|uniref:CAAX amino terminal protease family protein n=1 Tax=Granulicella sibirica TaxID=2479048 RepID=A0A4Q0T036_9BACT|nr:CAAX amino terminal protease family protein [Granulicella sibirica]
MLYGEDGLRAGWGLLTFIVLFAALAFAASFLVAKIQHKPFGPGAQKAPASQTSDQPKSANASPASVNPHKETPPKNMLTGEGLSALVVLLVTFIMSRIEKRGFGFYGLGSKNRIAHFLQGALWGLVCLSLLILVLKLGGFLVFDGRLLTNAAALRYSLIWAFGFTFVAILEETLLRGYLQFTLARGLAGIYGAISKTRHRHLFGFWAAAFILSFVFGLGHGSNPGESPLGLIAAGFAGLVFCYTLYRTGSLWWALGAHASWDWGQSFLYGVADSGTMVEGHLFATHPIGQPILSGGLTGPEGSVFVLPVLLLLALIVFLTIPAGHPPGYYLSHPDES